MPITSQRLWAMALAAHPVCLVRKPRSVPAEPTTLFNALPPRLIPTMKTAPEVFLEKERVRNSLFLFLAPILDPLDPPKVVLVVFVHPGRHLLQPGPLAWNLSKTT